MWRRSYPRRIATLLLGLSVIHAGCHVPVIDRARNIVDGVPRLGMSTCCPPEQHPGAGGILGKCDLRRYGRRPLCGDVEADKLVPWHDGPDCDGRWLVLERLIGRRRAGHWIPFLSSLGIGRPARRPVFSAPLTPAAEAATLPNAVLFFSLGRSSTIEGLRIRNEDIVGFDGRHVARLFDGSDVGLGKLKIDGFAIVNDHQILITFSEAFTVDAKHALPGLSGDVDDSDILLFDAQQLGEVTRGSFSMYFDASDVGLTTDEEDVDAVAIRADGSLILSTVGDASVGGANYRDEDLLLFHPKQVGPDTLGSWSRFLDGSDIDLSSSGEDVDAVSLDSAGNVYLSVRGELETPAVRGGAADVFKFIPESTGVATAGRFARHRVFESHWLELRDNDVTGIDVPWWAAVGN